MAMPARNLGAVPGAPIAAWMSTTGLNSKQPLSPAAAAQLAASSSWRLRVWRCLSLSLTEQHRLQALPPTEV